MTAVPPSPLVGRDRELGILRARLTAALVGNGNLVLIGGEAGIGKTALAETLCREAAEQSALVLVGRCFDLTETPPYGPWVELFGRYHETDGPSLPAAFAQRGTVSPVTNQVTLFQQVLDFFTALTTQCPLVLLLDDLHWADPASLDLLRFVARSPSPMPFLLIATYRADELTRRQPLYQLLPLLLREASAVRLDLRRWSATDVATLITSRYRLSAEDIAPLVAYLHARSGGNPFFTGELLRTLEEEGRLQSGVDRSTLGDLTDVRVPALLRQVIDARLARLSDEVQTFLSVASVIGQEMSLPLWAAVAGGTEDAVLAVVEEAAQARLLEETPDGTHARFVHALIREALYAGIGLSRRRRLHRDVGEAVVRLPDPDPDMVAYHFRQAQDVRAAEWLVKAGDRAQRAWAWPTAMERYETARTLLEASSAIEAERGWLYFRLASVSAFYNTQRQMAYLEEASRLAVVSEDRVLAANSLLEHGFLRFMRGDIPGGLAEIEEGLTVLGGLSPAERSRAETLKSIGVTDEQSVRGSLFTSLAYAGRHAEARALEPLIFAGRASVARSGSERAAVAFAYRGLGMMHASLGQPEDARQAYAIARAGLYAEGNDLEAGLTALDELRDVALVYRADDVAGRRALAAEAERLYVRSSSHQTLIPSQRGRLPLMIVEGDWIEARAVGEAVVAVGGYGGYLSHAHSELGPLAHAQGDTELARRLVKEALPAGPASVPGETPWFAASLVMQRLAATLAIDAGDLPAARQWLEAHDHWLAWSGAVHGRSEGEALWAQYYWRNGEIDQADTHAQQALAHALEPRQPLALLAAHRLLGALDTDAGRFEQAHTHLDAALALADACAAPYERALTLLSHADLRAATGDRESAQALLADVRSICVPLGSTPTLARADALAAQLAATKQPAPTFPAGLSAREVDVLRLLAAGKTNQEIADALFLSERTINVHINHIYTKTRADNRAAATAFAYQHGLA